MEKNTQTPAEETASEAVIREYTPSPSKTTKSFPVKLVAWLAVFVIGIGAIAYGVNFASDQLHGQDVPITFDNGTCLETRTYRVPASYLESTSTVDEAVKEYLDKNPEKRKHGKKYSNDLC